MMSFAQYGFIITHLFLPISWASLSFVVIVHILFLTDISEQLEVSSRFYFYGILSSQL